MKAPKTPHNSLTITGKYYIRSYIYIFGTACPHNYVDKILLKTFRNEYSNTYRKQYSEYYPPSKTGTTVYHGIRGLNNYVYHGCDITGQENTAEAGGVSNLSPIRPLSI